MSKLIASFIAIITFVTVPVSQASAMTYSEMIDQINWLESQVLVLQDQLDALESTSNSGQVLGVSTTNTNKLFDVYVDDQLIFSDSASISKTEARITCERYAYNTDYMWKPVRCVYDNTVIYHDIFVAG